MNASGTLNDTNTLSRILTLGGCLLILAGILVTTGCSQQASLDPDARMSQTPVVDETAHRVNFDYPSKPPSLMGGKKVFAQNCASCHAGSFFQQKKVQNDLLYSTPVDIYIMLNTGEPPVLTETAKASGIRRQLQLASGATHPRFRNDLNRDEIWDAVFYARHLAGGSDITTSQANAADKNTIASIYGGNCAVCHGKKGNADGPLHTGHPSSHELAPGKVHGGIFFPAPARFTQYDRLFNRTDAQLFKYISEGVYPSGMPAWLGNVDKERGFVYDDELIWTLVKHLRSLAISYDLPETTQNPAGLSPSAGERPPLSLKIPPVKPYDRSSYAGGKDVKSIPEFDKIQIRGSKMPLLEKEATE